MSWPSQINCSCLTWADPWNLHHHPIAGHKHWDGLANPSGRWVVHAFVEPKKSGWTNMNPLSFLRWIAKTCYQFIFIDCYWNVVLFHWILASRMSDNFSQWINDVFKLRLSMGWVNVHDLHPCSTQMILSIKKTMSKLMAIDFNMYVYIYIYIHVHMYVDVWSPLPFPLLKGWTRACYNSWFGGEFKENGKKRLKWCKPIL